MTKLRKTPLNKRNNFIEVHADGSKLEIRNNGIAIKTYSDGTQYEFELEDMSNTNTYIHMLHKMDDRDVDNYYKNARPKRTEEEKAKIKKWEKQYVQDFKERHGYEPHPSDVKAEVNEQFPRNYNLSLNTYDDECEEGKNPIQKEIYDFSMISNENPRVDRLHEILPMLTDEQRWLIQKIYFEGASQVEIAKELGIAPPSITKRLSRIHSRLKKLF